MLVTADNVGFGNVANVDDRLGRQEAKLARYRLMASPCWYACGKGLEDRLDYDQQLGIVGVAFGAAPKPLGAAFETVEVRQDQFRFDDLNVAFRVDDAAHVDDVGVVETAHHVGYSRHFPDVGEELVTKALTLMGALDEAGDVDELDARRHDGRFPLWFRVQLAERREPLVRYRHDTDVPIYGRERIVRGFDSCFG